MLRQQQDGAPAVMSAAAEIIPQQTANRWLKQHAVADCNTAILYDGKK